MSFKNQYFTSLAESLFICLLILATLILLLSKAVCDYVSASLLVMPSSQSTLISPYKASSLKSKLSQR